MNIYEKLAKARATLELKKTGTAQVNAAGKTRSYFSLDDILPKVNKLADELKFLCKFDLNENEAVLTIIDTEKPETEKIYFSIPATRAQLNGGNVVQSIGATQTYLRRYLYLNAFEIAEFDEIEEQSAESGKGAESSKGAERQTGGKRPPAGMKRASDIQQPTKEIWTEEKNSIFMELVGKLPEERKAVYRKLLDSTSPSDIIDMARAEVETRAKEAQDKKAETKEQGTFSEMENIEKKSESDAGFDIF